MKHSFVVYGKIVGQHRPRFRKDGRTYSVKSDNKYRNAIRNAYKKSGGKHFKPAPLSLTVTAFRKLPKSKPKKVISESDTFKPDASNILKQVEDALNGLAYDDDRYIVETRCVKHPRTRIDEERLFITIEELGNTND